MTKVDRGSSDGTTSQLRGYPSQGSPWLAMINKWISCSFVCSLNGECHPSSGALHIRGDSLQWQQRGRRGNPPRLGDTCWGVLCQERSERGEQGPEESGGQVRERGPGELRAFGGLEGTALGDQRLGLLTGNRNKGRAGGGLAFHGGAYWQGPSPSGAGQPLGFLLRHTCSHNLPGCFQ